MNIEEHGLDFTEIYFDRPMDSARGEAEFTNAGYADALRDLPRLVEVCNDLQVMIQELTR